MDINKIRNIRTLITHKDCPDGIASALIIKDAIPDVKIIFVNYGTKEYQELKSEPGILFCDISPDRNRVQEFIDCGAMILDHHIGAKDIIEAFGDNGRYADETLNPGVSGAVLAFNEIWYPIYSGRKDALVKTNRWNQTHEELWNRVETFARLIGIVDTWQRDSKDWLSALEVSASIKFYPTETVLNDGFDKQKWQEKMSLGKILIQKRDIETKKALRDAYKTEFMGLKITLIQGSRYVSDLSDVCEDGTDLIIGFSYISNENVPSNWHSELSEKNPRLVLSLRTKNNFDVSKLAKFYGGGGHRGASGCTIQVKNTDNNPYVHILNLIKEYICSQ